MPKTNEVPEIRLTKAEEGALQIMGYLEGLLHLKN
jgi:hypothetical protein